MAICKLGFKPLQNGILENLNKFSKVTHLRNSRANVSKYVHNVHTLNDFILLRLSTRSNFWVLHVWVYRGEHRTNTDKKLLIVSKLHFSWEVGPSTYLNGNGGPCGQGWDWIKLINLNQDNKQARRISLVIILKNILINVEMGLKIKGYYDLVFASGFIMSES